MKKFTKLMVMALGIMLMVCVSAAIVVGCNKVEQDEPPIDCTVTIAEYDQNKGSVEINADSYKSGDKVTVTVTPKKDYKISSMHIDNINVTAAVKKGGGIYEFTVSKDREIKVQFGDADKWSVNVNDFNEYKGSVELFPALSEYQDSSVITVTIQPSEVLLNRRDGSDATASFLLGAFEMNGEDMLGELKHDATDNTYSYEFIITDDIDLNVRFDDDVSIIKHAYVDSFDAEINREDGGLVLVDFYALWCGPCMNYLAPAIEELIEDRGNPVDVKVVKLEISDYSQNPYPERDLFYKYYSDPRYGNTDGAIPFVLLFQNGKVIKWNAGAFTSADQIIQWIQS